MPLQDGDVPATHADVSELQAWTDFKPGMPVPQGIQNFVAWYRATTSRSERSAVKLRAFGVRLGRHAV